MGLFFAVSCASSTGSIGAVLGKDVHDGRLYVREVPPAMGAAYAGLHEGDEIVAIDGAPATDLTPKEVHAKLEGRIGSQVTLIVIRSGASRTVVVQRGPLAPSHAE